MLVRTTSYHAAEMLWTEIANRSECCLPYSEKIASANMGKFLAPTRSHHDRDNGSSALINGILPAALFVG